VPHELGTVAPPGTGAGPAAAADLVGATVTSSCHVLGPNQVLPRMHNLDERD
jgi:hypothetical protein